MAGHDHHFLSRLDRVSDEHVELSLSLYRDSMLLRLVVSTCGIEDRHERVAIAIGPADRGPFIIVARDGGFVTCLGEGMSPVDLPIISRAKLDSIAKNVPHLHQKIEFAKRCGHSRRSIVEQLRDQLTESGADLCREDFQAALALQPLLGPYYFHWLCETETAAASLRERLYGVQRCTSSVEESLHHFFQLVFSTGNLAMLAAWDSRPLLRALGPGNAEGAIFGIPWSAIYHGMSAAMYRGLWAAGRLGKPLLVAAKHNQASQRGDPGIWTVIGSIAAVGMRHLKLRAEARKSLLPPWYDSPSDSGQLSYSSALVAMLAGVFGAALDAPEAMAQAGRELARKLAYQTLRAGGSSTYASPEDIPSSLATEFVAYGAHPFMRVGSNAIGNLALMVPWAVSLEAEAFFLPRSERRERGFLWVPEHTLSLLESYRKYKPRRPRRAAPQVGPNAPCPCGTGKKYKKCCGTPGAKAQQS